ncbi:hypothetical protein [Micromonospora sp. CB01531]|uniref:hypothetical protein n=1 Tax=Micromonospora sp. CB01531 TaxID=1718947 RepID=UPI00093D899C|nr:hypothetical protein [Micromonospora sp. CB01531]OKI84553.1 hypothetical protein A6A27_40380 [Micromonospora sp. CB01531]
MAAPFVWLLRAAGPRSWQRLVSALGDRLDEVAWSAPQLPAELFDAMLASGRPQLIEVMARSVDPTGDRHADLRQRLAATGNAEVASRAISFWGLRDRRAVFAAGRPDDPAWAGLVTTMLAVTKPDGVRATVVSPFPGLITHAFAVAGEELTRAELLRGLLSIVDVGASLDDPVLLSIAERAGTSLGIDRASLARLVAEAEGTAGAIEELRDGADVEQLGLRSELDWDQILAAHGCEPFGEEATILLAGRPDCPEGVHLALFATHPLAVVTAARPSVVLLAAPLPARHSTAVAKRRADEAVKAGLPADALLRASPAPAVLEALHRHRVVLEELRALVGDRLGADVGRWRVLRARLKGYRGSSVDLLTEEPAGRPPTAWPDAKPIPDVCERKTVNGVRAAFLALLDAAPTDTHLALFDHVDDHTIFDLLSRGQWRDEWLDAALASPNPALRRSLSTRRDLDAAAIDRLATCDDPVVNNQLFRATNLSWHLRKRILSQRPFADAGSLPLDPALREHLLAYQGGSGLSPYHARDAIDCVDLDLQLHIPRYRLVYGEIPQLRLVVNLWRRHGRAAVDELLAVTNGPATFQGRLLSSAVIKRVTGPDPEMLSRLEDEVTRGETVAAQLALLRGVTGPSSASLRETHDWNWKAIRDEHAERPFPDDILAALCTRPGCPQWFRTAFATTLEAGLSRGEPPADLLAQILVDRETVPKLIAAGRLSWSDVFAHGRPAAQALTMLTFVKDEGQQEGLAALRLAIESTVDGNPEAWVLAAHMLPDFAGSVAELLFTATAATG